MEPDPVNTGGYSSNPNPKYRVACLATCDLCAGAMFCKNKT